jgi:hypothetical protein
VPQGFRRPVPQGFRRPVPQGFRCGMEKEKGMGVVGGKREN